MVISPAQRIQKVKEYYFSQKLQQIANMRAEGKNVLNLGVGSPDLCPSAATINTLKKIVDSPFSHGYQSYRGIYNLRAAISKWNKKFYNTKLDPESEILPLMGSKEGIMLISLAFVNCGDGVLVPNPGYPTYLSVSEIMQASVYSYSLDEKNNWEIDWEDLYEKDLTSIKLMWVNYPNMPTGAKASLKQFDKLIRFAADSKILLVNDNPYSLILNEEPISIRMCDGANEVALELNSLSKSHNMAGWRIGYVTGGKKYIDTILKVKSNMDSGMFLPLQMAAVESLRNEEDWHKKQNEIYEERKKLALELLNALNCSVSSNQVGMFVWAKIEDSERNAEKFTEEILQKYNLFITPGLVFGSNGIRYVRVSLCSPKEDFIEAIKRVKT